MHISTSKATTTTRADMIKPCTIGRMPDFFNLEKDVFKPIAARAHTIKNLLVVFVPDTTAAGIVNTLATMDIARKPRINQGKILVILKFAFKSPAFPQVARASFLLSLSCINAKIITVGIMERVLVSLTIVA